MGAECAPDWLVRLLYWLLSNRRNEPMPGRQVLSIGERFPLMEASIVGGDRIRIPEDLAGRMAVLLFYRGKW